MTQTPFSSIKIGLASPKIISDWSYGEVTRPETINYRTQKPEKNGLFCEVIFGPQKDWECCCGHLKKQRYKGKKCPRCGVEITRAKVRRERMGHIELCAPVTHIWYYKGIPSRIGIVLGIPPKELESVIYFKKYLVTDVGETMLRKGSILTDKEYSEQREKYGEDFVAKIGAEAVLELLEEYSRYRFDGFIRDRISVFSKITGFSEKELEDYLNRRVYLLESVPEIDPDDPNYYSHEREFRSGQIISRAMFEEAIVSLNFKLRAEAQKSRVDRNAPIPNDRQVIYHTGSQYIEKLFDKFVLENPDSPLLTNLSDEEFSERYQGEDALNVVRKDKSKWENNLERVVRELKVEFKTAKQGHKKLKLIQRIDVIDGFLKSGNEPEWMILRNIPVIPPELRPMVLLDGGRFATSDLNDLYRRVINRNNRLSNLIKLHSPAIIIRNEKRLLQEAVDALIDNTRNKKSVTAGPSNRPLRSLSDMLKGKQGRFRQNLLGKRVDYSGRSVIVVGPDLKMHQCGLPKEMAVELFKPFVMKELVKRGKALNIKAAKKQMEKADDEVWGILEEIIKDHPVLLNRAPTLHRLGIQAFMPVLVEGRAIKLHPLVCTAYNADFDGDQMAVHLPLSFSARKEAKNLMLASGNLLKPSDGRPVTVPTQDMVLGAYYLTLEKDDKYENDVTDEDGNIIHQAGDYIEVGGGKIFCDANEALMAYQEEVISLHAPIKIRKTITNSNGIAESRIISTTAGRIIFNEHIPQDLGFVDRTDDSRRFEYEVFFKAGKEQLVEIIDRIIKIHGTAQTALVLDKIKALGFKYSTKAAITVAVADATIPPQKKDILKAADSEIDEITEWYNDGEITDSERKNYSLEVWDRATKEVAEKLKMNLHKYNPIFMMADSGARGSMNQIRQLAGMRGLIANTSGETIEIPIRANYREGLNILEYFISSRGARKGLSDTALRTADSGYLTRRLVDVSQEVIIRQDDCGATEGITVYEIREGKELIEPMIERLTGRHLTEDFVCEETSVHYKADLLLTEKEAEKIIASLELKKVVLPENFKNIARSLRKIANPENGVRLLCDVSRYADIIDECCGINIHDTNELYTRVKDGNYLTSKSIGEIISDLTEEKVQEAILKVVPLEELDGYITTLREQKMTTATVSKIKVRSVLACRSVKGVCARCYGASLTDGQPVVMGEAVGIIAAQSIGEPGTQLTMRTFHTGGIASAEDITQGLPRVEELFESRRPKSSAIITKVSGKIKFDEKIKNITVENKDEDGKVVKTSYKIDYGYRVKVEEDTWIEAGDPLTEGSLNPHDILEVKGVEAVQNYIIAEVQKVYRLQGVKINDKHIEVIVRQMMRKLTVNDPGDSMLLSGALTDKSEIARVNASLKQREEDELLKPKDERQEIQYPTTKPHLLGITKASLAIDSFLSAASFQETTRVLTDAAIRGKVDELEGLKENVIIGKLIPAGTGLIPNFSLQDIPPSNGEDRVNKTEIV